jgi:hypothetical protein
MYRKCRCGQKINFQSRDEHSYNWEQLYCSKECWKNSPEYRIRKSRFIKLYKSLNDVQKTLAIENAFGMPIDYMDEIYYWLEELNESLDSS